jgi:hypothetical protein
MKKRHACIDCGKRRVSVTRKGGQCEECEEDKDYCCICDKFVDMYDNSDCHHIYESEMLVRIGSGSDEGMENWTRECLFLLFSYLGEAAVVALRAGLLSGHFQHRLSGSMLGPLTLEYNVGGHWFGGARNPDQTWKDAYSRGADGYWSQLSPVADATDIGEAITKLQEDLYYRDSRDFPKIQDAVSWLRSFWPGEENRMIFPTADLCAVWLGRLAGFDVQRHYDERGRDPEEQEAARISFEKWQASHRQEASANG